MAHRIENRLVFGLNGNEVLALVLVKVRSPLDGQVIGLGCARRPNDFLGIGVNVGGNLGTGLVNGLFRFPSVCVRAAGGVPELLAQVGDHLFGHTRIDRRRCRIVQINRTLQIHTLLPFFKPVYS